MESIQNILKNTIGTKQGTYSKEKNKEWLEMKAKTFNDTVGDLKYYDCPKCKNKGFIAKVVYIPMYDDYEEVMTTCECKRKRQALYRAAKSGLGDYINKRFNDYEATEDWQKNVKAKTIEYCKSENNYWFVTTGQSGAGKTLISSIIANYLLLKQEKEVIYITWTDFISKLKRDMMGDNTDEVSDYLDNIKNVEVLYIDELLKKYNETDLRYIIEIINYRYTNNLKTIISSERTIDELLDIDEATFGRVIEKADRFIINIPKDRKKNYRLKNLL